MPVFSASDLTELVADINDLHLKFSAAWYHEVNESAINLKKIQVNHIVDNDNIPVDMECMKLIDGYHTQLNWMSTFTDFEYKYASYDVRSRVKQKDSILNKLVHYRITNIEGGKVPLNKCLNDIYGLRIMFDKLNHENADFRNCIDQLKREHGLRVVSKNKEVEGYVATHLYFRNGNNKFFPWELQIWSQEDSLINEESHAAHKSKRKYTSWPMIYKEDITPERRDL